MKKKKFFYGKHSINNKDISAVTNAIKSNLISQGKELKKFEDKVAKFTGSKFCLAVSSGTAALHIAVLSLNLKKGFLGVTSPITFAATPNSIIGSGGILDLIDIDPKTFNLSSKNLEKYLNDRKNKKKIIPKLIIPVNFAGSTSEMDKLYKIAKINNIKVVEDASQAMGGAYKNKKIGSCKYSDVTVFSLHPVKTITSGEGGIVLTNKKNLYEKMKLLRANGVRKTNKPSWFHNVENFGLNYKISEINCALGNSQLTKINKFINIREKIAKFYLRNINNKVFSFQKIDPNCKSAWHLFIIKFNKPISKRKKSIFYNILKDKNIFLDLKYKPLDMMPYYKKKFKLTRCINARNYFDQTFCLPIYPGLKHKDLKYIVKNINETALKLDL